jgi:hypothetical protein
MPAFSHFFLKRLSARSKFSSSWIMTSDKFYFPPSWRLCAGLGQTDKLRRDKGMGQAKPSHSFGAACIASAAKDIAGTSAGVLFGSGLSLLEVRVISAEPSVGRSETAKAHRLSLVGRRLRGHPPTSLPGSARKRVWAWRLARARDLLDPLHAPAFSGQGPCRASAPQGGNQPALRLRRCRAVAVNEHPMVLQVCTGRRGCPLRERPQPAPLLGGAVQRAAKRRSSR